MVEPFIEPLVARYLDELSAHVRSGCSDGLRVVADDVLQAVVEHGLDPTLYALGLGVYHQPFVCPVLGVCEMVGGHTHGFIVSDGAWVRPLLALARLCLDEAGSPTKARERLHTILFDCYRSGCETPFGDFERGGRLLWLRLDDTVNRVRVLWVTVLRELPSSVEDCPEYYFDALFPVSVVVVPSLVLREWVGGF